jgi:hypothetical protein
VLSGQIHEVHGLNEKVKEEMDLFNYTLEILSTTHQNHKAYKNDICEKVAWNTEAR